MPTKASAPIQTKLMFQAFQLDCHVQAVWDDDYTGYRFILKCLYQGRALATAPTVNMSCEPEHIAFVCRDHRTECINVQ